VLRRISWFWALVAALLATSAVFALNVERQRRALQAAGVDLKNDAVVSVSSVVDGDTVVVKTETGDSVSVRLVGIKAFKAGTGIEATDRFGRAAVEAIQRATENRPARVLLNTPPKDKYGRTLATLMVDDQDLALGLVSKGVVLVYTVYPFPAMALYLREKEAARADRRGFWGDPTVAARADLLEQQWRTEAP
jgi:endonuclease YncB( thermonuclease family)